MSEMNEQGLTSADMYDEDVKQIAVMWRELMAQYSRKPNDHYHVGEMAKRAQDSAFKIGYVVRVHTSECLLGIGPATIEIVGRVPGHEFKKHGMDHEKQRHNVLRAVERNEDKSLRKIIKAIEPDVRR
jgi:hypothetical protein